MIDNATPYGAAAAFAYDLDDRPLAVLCVSASFNMPAGGGVHAGPLQASDEQPPPPMADAHFANPAASSLRLPGQGVPRRLQAEIYVQGPAWAPRGRAVTELRTRVRVDECRKELVVIGDRYWQRGLTGIRPSAPLPFVTMPLQYERSYGGTVIASNSVVKALEPRNPIGRGLWTDADGAVDQPLPNLEKPGERMTSWSDRLTPWAYGPIPAAWQPRLRWAGTFDAVWAANRLPLWPKDTDPRFFNAAASGLTMGAALRGGELVVLEGFHPDGDIAFRLPELRVVAKSYFEDRVERRAMPLEAVLLDTGRHSAVLFWRVAVALGRARSAHLRSVVRVAEPWENVPQ